MDIFLRQIKISLRAIAVLSVLTGLLYPLAITGIAQIVFPGQISGSLIRRGGKAIGSSLIGQGFDEPRYFWGRLSATSPPYNAVSSSGSNLGPLNPDLLKAAAARVQALRAAEPGRAEAVPVDLATASGSGLDPDISPAAAYFQASRIARARGLALDDVRRLVAQATRGRFWGVLGEPRVNVLELNLSLDALGAKR